MIPYFQAGQSFVVAKGNPQGIKTTDDLCGKSVAAETGTTEVDYLNGTGDYKGTGLSKACTDKGKAEDRHEGVPQGHRRPRGAYRAARSTPTSPTRRRPPIYTIQHPDQFELSGIRPLQALGGHQRPEGQDRAQGRRQSGPARR